MDRKLEHALKEASAAGPASEEQVSAAEQELNVSFPKAYKDFLKQFGAVVGNGFEIAGVFSGDTNISPPLWRHIVAITMQYRRAHQNRLPETLLPISDDGSGVTYYLDASNEASPMGQVLGYGPGIDGIVISASFNEFVMKLATQELEL